MPRSFLAEFRFAVNIRQLTKQQQGDRFSQFLRLVSLRLDMRLDIKTFRSATTSWLQIPVLRGSSQHFRNQATPFV